VLFFGTDFFPVLWIEFSLDIRSFPNIHVFFSQSTSVTCWNKLQALLGVAMPEARPNKSDEGLGFIMYVKYEFT
jgi:hypothetical protein